MGPVGICGIFKDEADDLLEWIAYHIAIGFDHIVLYDNGSTDGGAQRVSSSPLAQFVTFIDWPPLPGQLPAYTHFCEHLSGAFEWAAFTDIDEFIHPLEGLSIKEVLPRYRHCSGVLVEWLTFGPSGHSRRPAGLVLENYDFRLPDDSPRCRMVKSIVKPSEIISVGDGPHVFRVKGDLCNSRGQVVPPFAQLPECHDVLVINHYYTRSKEDWVFKKRRGAVMYPENLQYYRDQDFDQHASAAVVHDERIKRFVPLVKRVLTTTDEEWNHYLGADQRSAAQTLSPPDPISVKSSDEFGERHENREVIEYLQGQGRFAAGGNGKKCLELGAGGRVRPGWLATDLTAQEHILELDITRPFPIPDRSFDYAYSEHMIEHVPFDGGFFMLKECFRILKPGGTLRIVTPSVGFLFNLFLTDRSELQEHYIDWATRSFVPNAPRPAASFVFNHFVRGFGHQFIYDRATMRAALSDAGFAAIKECLIGKSEHNSLQNLESVERLPEGFLALESMIFEASRPT